MRIRDYKQPPGRVDVLIPHNHRGPVTREPNFKPSPPGIGRVIIYDAETEEILNPWELEEPERAASETDPEQAAREADSAFLESVDKVGWGHPPKAHQFKPGQSGNPGGRPKGHSTAYLREILRVDAEGRIVKAVVGAWIGLACRGNSTALRELLNRIDGSPAEPSPGIASSEQTEPAAYLDT